MQRRTKRKINIDLLNECAASLGVIPIRVIKTLLDMWDDGDLVILEYTPQTSEYYKNVDIYIDPLILQRFTQKCFSALGEIPTNMAMTDILMFNYLNQ